MDDLFVDSTPSSSIVSYMEQYFLLEKMLHLPGKNYSTALIEETLNKAQSLTSNCEEDFISATYHFVI